MCVCSSVDVVCVVLVFFAGLFQFYVYVVCACERVPSRVYLICLFCCVFSMLGPLSGTRAYKYIDTHAHTITAAVATTNLHTHIHIAHTHMHTRRCSLSLSLDRRTAMHCSASHFRTHVHKLPHMQSSSLIVLYCVFFCLLPTFHHGRVVHLPVGTKNDEDNSKRLVILTPPAHFFLCSSFSLLL